MRTDVDQRKRDYGMKGVGNDREKFGGVKKIKKILVWKVGSPSYRNHFCWNSIEIRWANCTLLTLRFNCKVFGLEGKIELFI